MWTLKTQGLIWWWFHTRSMKGHGEGKPGGALSCTIHISASRGQTNSKQKAKLLRIRRKMLRAWLQGQSITHDGFDLYLRKLNFISFCDVPLFALLHFRGEHHPMSQWVSLPEDINSCFYFSSFSTAYFFQGAFFHFTLYIYLFYLFWLMLLMLEIVHKSGDCWLFGQWEADGKLWKGLV